MSLEIINRVQEEISHRGWSKREFVDRLNPLVPQKYCVSPQMFYQWERRGKIPEKYHKPIADLFGWSIELLISGDDGKDTTYSLRELEIVQKLRQMSPSQRDALSTLIEEILKGNDSSRYPNISVKGARKKTKTKKTSRRV